MHRRIAGEVAAEIARQVAEPIRALRDRLGLVVDHIERHVAQATGPTPYPWRSLQTLRQDLGATYLELLVRDFAASIGALMLATRVGAGIAAEIGSMVVTEQIDALRMCAADPIDFLIVPRFVASMVMTLCLIVWAALVAFVAGSVLLFDPDAVRGVDFGVARPVIAAAALVSALFFMVALGMALRARHRPVVSGREHMIGSAGKVVAWEGGKGTVRVVGEVWNARAASPLFPGDPVRVVGVEGLTVIVEPNLEAGEPGARR